MQNIAISFQFLFLIFWQQLYIAWRCVFALKMLWLPLKLALNSE